MVTGIMRTDDRICAAGSVQSAINVVPQDMGNSMRSLVKYVISWIVRRSLRTVERRGLMDFPGKSEVQAAMIFYAAQGAMQYGRAHGEKKSRAVMKQIEETLKPRK